MLTTTNSLLFVRVKVAVHETRWNMKEVSPISARRPLFPPGRTPGEATRHNEGIDGGHHDGAKPRLLLLQPASAKRRSSRTRMPSPELSPPSHILPSALAPARLQFAAQIRTPVKAN